MLKKAYSVETKLTCIEMKKAGKSNKVIKETLGIKNNSQIYTWMRWHKNEELHRFHPPVGKQDSYGKGLEELSEVEQLRLLKKIHGLIVNCKKVYRIMKERGWLCRARPKKVPNIGQPYYVTENKLDCDF